MELADADQAIRAVKNGDKACYGTIVANYQQQLFKYCFHMLGQPQEAEDVTQDVFVKGLEHLIFLGDLSIKINGVAATGTTFSTQPHQLNAQQSVGILTLDIDPSQAGDSFELELTVGEVTGFKDGCSAEQNRVVGKWTLPPARIFWSILPWTLWAATCSAR